MSDCYISEASAHNMNLATLFEASNIISGVISTTIDLGPNNLLLECNPVVSFNTAGIDN